MSLVAGGTMLASCVGDAEVAPSPAAAATPAPAAAAVSDTPVRVGAPYQMGGQTYTPVDQYDYDEVGYASWYGDELAGRPTANGEAFAPDAISAAHRTLPMPSYVEVTRLDTGRTILVRINDRGPASNRRLIDLSAGAARQLGIDATGTVAVRVRRTNPVESERLALRSGQPVPERLVTPESLLAILRERAGRLPSPTAGMAPPSAVATARPTAPAAAPPPPSRVAVPVTSAPPASATPPAAAAGHLFVQLGAFSSRQRAEAMAQRIGATVSTTGNIHRVRYGPFATEAEAQAGVARARARGMSGAVIVRER